jgi:hypothetical protein
MVLRMKRPFLAAALAMFTGSLMACSNSSPAEPTPPANIAGSYNATITASSTCASVPSAARELALGAEVSQTGAAANVVFNPHGGNPVTVAGTVSGQTISFPSLSISGSQSGNAMSIAAAASTGNVGAGGVITAPLNGTYQGAGASCTAGDHQLHMKRCVITCSGGICVCQ